ncbi:FecR family protein [Steroidobacter flavus]|uniref:FecR family protein n=1 Tax=Steroidobacter flavus TaxID=1842136 RepID=A0ABV8SXR9_9GAMM
MNRSVDSNAPDGAATSAAEQAADWFARQETGALSEAANLEFRAWLAGDPANAQAYDAIKCMWSTYDLIPPSAVGEQLAVESSSSTRLTSSVIVSRRDFGSRRRRFHPKLIGMMAAAVCALAVLISFNYGARWQADMFTAVGEVRTVSLPDGSTVTLNTDSAVRLRFDEKRRIVELLAGEADFKVTADRERPFIVEAAGGSARALGTQFAVRHDETGATVTVEEHDVAVTFMSTPGAQPQTQTLSAGQSVTYSSAAGLQAVRSVDLDRATSWRRGWLSFEDRPLGEVIDELDRYLPGWIKITNPDLRARHVTCAIPLDQPALALDHLKQTLGLRTVRLTPYLTLIRE